MQLSHARSAVDAVFDDPNLVSCAGLAPVLALAGRAGLADLVAATVKVHTAGGANAHLKVPALVAGMVAGADSIDDMDLLRHGGMGRLFAGVRAPSTLGTFLRSFSFGHVRQLDAVAARFLSGLAKCAPLLPGADRVAYVDIDDTVKATHGYAKEGAGYGYTGIKGLNALLATICTPLAAPVIAATRLRKGSANSARGAARLVADALTAAKAAGADPEKGSLVIVRADSAYYTWPVVAAATRHGARFSITARTTPAVQAAIAAIPADAWTAIHYPNAFADPDTGELISDAEVAEIGFTAFTGRAQREQVTARLIVRRVKRLAPATTASTATATPDVADDGAAKRESAKYLQGELFTAYRYHACFTNSPLSMLDAEAAHRGHAVVEQVIADLKGGPLAHLPSGRFAANSAWLVCAAMAFNLTRATACLASTFHARATTATIRNQLITVPARIARSARRLTLHLPTDWPWQVDWQQLHAAAMHPPPAAAA